MTDVDASRDMPQAASSPAPVLPMRLKLAAVLAALAALVAAGALWARFGEGVYAQILLNAFIACF